MSLKSWVLNPGLGACGGLMLESVPWTLGTGYEVTLALASQWPLRGAPTGQVGTALARNHGPRGAGGPEAPTQSGRPVPAERAQIHLHPRL